MAIKKIKAPIHTWKPTKETNFVDCDGKLFIIHFDKIFGINELSMYNKFMIKKCSYENQLDIIVKYANFFMNNYDPENELALAYIKLKQAIDKKVYDKDNMNALISAIYEIMFTPSIIEKIEIMTEENYLDDIESSDDPKAYSTKDKKHLESLEFTNQHIKLLLEISFCMKIMSPVIFHYFAINLIKLEKDSDYIFRFYEKLFDIFGKDCNMYNKLFIYVKAKVLESKSNNEMIYGQREILGVDEYSVINLFVRKVLISENMVKFKFNEIWDEKQHKFKENPIGFIKTIIKFQLTYFLKEQNRKNLTEVTSAKNQEGLSGIDKLYMNLEKQDENKAIMMDMIVKTTIKQIQERYDVEITDDELAYYKEHLKINNFQKELISAHFAKDFGNVEPLNLVNRDDFYRLILILKKYLLINAGYDKDYNGYSETSKLAYLMTGNIADDAVNTRVIRNNKFKVKIDESYLYSKLKDEKYSYLQEIKPDYILSLLSKFINTRFTYVCYEQPELLGTEITYNEDKLSDELLFFLYGM